ncbi:hypothetical protein GBA52_014976 [Prunus armeniaca]|nr:hypothetical protein GBA52_014976 [Prunus armeniaca]
MGPPMPRPCHVKLLIALHSIPRNSLNGQCQAMPRPRHAEGQGMPRPRHAMLPIASLSRNGLNGAIPRPRHAKLLIASLSRNSLNGAMPRPCHAKLPIASLSQNSLNGAMPRPRHAKATTCQHKARHAKAKAKHDMPAARQSKAKQSKATCKARQAKAMERQGRQAKAGKGKAMERHGKAKQARQGMPTQGKHAQPRASSMPRPKARLPTQEKGKARRQGFTKATARQGKHVKRQSVGWVASPSFGGKSNGKRRGRDESKRRRAESQWIVGNRHSPLTTTTLPRRKVLPAAARNCTLNAPSPPSARPSASLLIRDASRPLGP